MKRLAPTPTIDFQVIWAAVGRVADNKNWRAFFVRGKRCEKKYQEGVHIITLSPEVPLWSLTYTSISQKTNLRNLVGKEGSFCRIYSSNVNENIQNASKINYEIRSKVYHYQRSRWFACYSSLPVVFVKANILFRFRRCSRHDVELVMCCTWNHRLWVFCVVICVSNHAIAQIYI